MHGRDGRDAELECGGDDEQPARTRGRRHPREQREAHEPDRHAEELGQSEQLEADAEGAPPRIAERKERGDESDRSESECDDRRRVPEARVPADEPESEQRRDDRRDRNTPSEVSISPPAYMPPEVSYGSAETRRS